MKFGPFSQQLIFQDLKLKGKTQLKKKIWFGAASERTDHSRPGRKGKVTYAKSLLAMSSMDHLATVNPTT